MRAFAAILVVCAWSAAARADAPVTSPLPRGMQLVIAGAHLYVERGPQRAPIATGSEQVVMGFDKVTVDDAAGTVAVDVELCNFSAHLDLTLDGLEARLANVEGLALHRKKQYAKAAVAFRRAVALDPSFDLAAENLASALALGGKADEAAAALAPWIASNPTWTYLRVATDPELASLRGHRAITAMRAPKRGDVSIKDGAIAGGVVWSAARGEIAAVHVESSWGSCNWVAEIVVYDATTRALRATLPLVAWGDTVDECDSGPPALLPARVKDVAARGAAIQGALRELGFTTAGVLVGQEGERDDGSEVARFPAAKLAFAIDDSAKPPAPISLASAAGHLMRAGRAWWVPGPKLLVDEWRGTGSEGCDSTDPAGLELRAVP